MPSHVRPLADHPQLEILRTPLSTRQGDEVVEYRAYNFRRWRDGTVVRGDRAIGLDIVWTVVFAVLYRHYELSDALSQLLSSWGCTTPLAVWITLLVLIVYSKTRTVLYQSIIALPSLGVQLETTRGVSLRLPFADSLHPPSIAISTTSTFIPLEDVSTIVINEGLRLWRVEYYLAIIHRGGNQISVGYDVVRPPGAVLKEILRGLRETLYDEYAGEGLSEVKEI